MRVQREEGFSLLESVASLFVVTITLGVTVPLWEGIQTQERLTQRLAMASRLAVNEIEKAWAGGAHQGVWKVMEGGVSYTIQVDVEQTQQANGVRVTASFPDRGHERSVSYQTLVF